MYSRGHSVVIADGDISVGVNDAVAIDINISNHCKTVNIGCP